MRAFCKGTRGWALTSEWVDDGGAGAAPLPTRTKRNGTRETATHLLAPTQTALALAGFAARRGSVRIQRIHRGEEEYQQRKFGLSTSRRGIVLRGV